MLIRLGLGLVLLASLGCGDPGTSVHGSVSYDGQPIAQGSVSFRAVGGGTTFGGMIEEGRFAIDGAAAGEYTVQVRAVRKVDFAKSTEELSQAWEARQAAGGSQDDLADPADVMPPNAIGNGQQVTLVEGTERVGVDAEAARSRSERAARASRRRPRSAPVRRNLPALGSLRPKNTRNVLFPF